MGEIIFDHETYVRVCESKLYRELITGLASKFLRNEAEAQDLAQHVFEKLHDRIGRERFPDEDGVRGFLCTVTRNAALDVIRQRQRHAHLNNEAHIAGLLAGAGALDPSDGLFRAKIRSCFEKWEHLLSAYEREVLVRCVLWGEKPQEVAEAMNRTARAISTAKCLAIKTLLAAMTRCLGGRQ